jgi:16S rRNA (adenine1518-N6/adenine1519-N6)-dimethyltransferase
MDPSLNGPDPQSLTVLDVRRLLREAGLRPRKSLGQNFLVDEGALRRVASAADIRPDDLVLEIGAGVGSLTRHLAARARRVAAVEIDPHLVPVLRSVLAPFPNVSIVQGDILDLSPERILGKADRDGFTVAANIPYYITSAVIRHLVQGATRPRRIVLTVQKEVAERICAAPGKMSLLALSVQYYGSPSIQGKSPAESFYPVPDVDSAIVRVDLGGSPDRDADAADRMFRIARAGFAQKRKKLRNTLSAGLGLPAGRVERILAEAGVDSSRRPETLTVVEWERLAGKMPSGTPGG